MARERPGLASLIISPRIVRTGSMRVACSAGINPKNAVAITAPATRNTATRQSAGGRVQADVADIGWQARLHRAIVPWIATRDTRTPAPRPPARAPGSRSAAAG